MSLLEDVFLQDEANEAQELERVIEGGDFEERVASNSDDDSEKEDEAEEEKRRVDPSSTKTKRVVTNPRFILNPARLTGPRGIQVIPEHFKDFKFKGKGHEKEDVDLVLKKLEHWAYRLYPKFKFEDCLKKIETLGKKRPVMVQLQKIRSDQFLSDETVVQKDSSDEETQPEPDEFDKLLQEQIELARATPAPFNKSIDTSFENQSMTMLKPTSSPSISDEQRERMLQNRRLAEERRLAKLNDSKNSASVSNITNISDENVSKSGQNDINNSDENVSKTMVIEAQTHNNELELKENENQSEQIKHKSFNSFNMPNDELTDFSDKYIESQAKRRKSNIIDSSDDVIKDKAETDDNFESNEEQSDLNEAEGSKQVSNNSNENNRIDVRDIVLENSIIQSAIQGLVENDNNINLERDAMNQENIMHVDFNE